MSITLLQPRIGELSRSEFTEFLEMCSKQKINHNVDLRWLREDSYPRLFRGANEAGIAFTALWESKHLESCAVEPEDLVALTISTSTCCSPPSSGRVIGSYCPNRREGQLPMIGRDRRRRPYQYSR